MREMRREEGWTVNKRERERERDERDEGWTVNKREREGERGMKEMRDGQLTRERERESFCKYDRSTNKGQTTWQIPRQYFLAVGILCLD